MGERVPIGQEPLATRTPLAAPPSPPQPLPPTAREMHEAHVWQRLARVHDLGGEAASRVVGRVCDHDAAPVEVVDARRRHGLRVPAATPSAASHGYLGEVSIAEPRLRDATKSSAPGPLREAQRAVVRRGARVADAREPAQLNRPLCERRRADGEDPERRVKGGRRAWRPLHGVPAQGHLREELRSVGGRSRRRGAPATAVRRAAAALQ